MPNIQASPRNDLLGFIADKLKSGKSYGNNYEILKQIPLLGGTGLGDLFLGNSPELADDMSYNLSSAIRGGNRATGGLGTYTLDKRSADIGMTLADALGIGTGVAKLGAKGLSSLLNKSGFDASRRAFLEGRSAGLGKSTNEAAIDTASSILSPVNEVLQTPVSRRNVLKGAAAAGGLAATPTLLRNFVKDAEHVVPKVAEHSVDNIVNSTIKHKYNTLSEYLQHINKYVDDNFDSLKGYGDTPTEIQRSLLGEDEFMYDSLKKGDNYWGFDDKEITNRLNQFSPKAKQEMNAVKQLNPNWHSDPEVMKQLGRGTLWTPDGDYKYFTHDIDGMLEDKDVGKYHAQIHDNKSAQDQVARETGGRLTNKGFDTLQEAKKFKDDYWNYVNKERSKPTTSFDDNFPF